MNANPSHLEWVNPVAVGRVRAKQQQYSGSHRTSDDARDQVAALLIHGDAAFAGQGIVPETLMLSELLGYRTGGTLHFVINNQVGLRPPAICPLWRLLHGCREDDPSADLSSRQWRRR